MPLIYEDEQLLVLNKPAGLIAHRDGRTIEPSVAEWLGEQYPQLRGVGGDWLSPQGEKIPLNGLVHRLDRTTSGVLLVAKDEATFEYLKGELKGRKVEKVYRALVYGHVEGEGKIVAEIVRTSTPPKRWTAWPTTDDDIRAAITEYKSLKQFEIEGEAVSYIEARPLTGRTHQIRVHLASIGHAIVADHLYAPGRPALGFTRPMLHAYSLAFMMNGQHYEFVAPLPDDFVSSGAVEY